MFAVMVALAGAVVTAHSVTGGDHMGDGLVMCLAVVEGAIAAFGVAVVGGALAARPQWLVAPPVLAESIQPLAVLGVRARAGPVRLQVFRR